MNINLPFQIPNLPQRLQKLDEIFSNINGPHLKELTIFLMSQRTDFEHIILLIEFLKLMKGNKVSLMGAAIELKNIFKSQYKVFSYNRNPTNEMMFSYFQNAIITIYLHLPKEATQIEAMLLDCIKIFIKKDFPEKWSNLLDILKTSLSNDNHQRNYKIFKLLHKITKKYEYSSRSDKLYSEIILVIEKMLEPLMFYTTGYVTSIMNSDVNLIQNLQNLVKLLKIFYHLIYQDIHDSINEHLSNWAALFKNILSDQFLKTCEVNASKQTNKNQASEIRNLSFICKGEVIRITLLFSTKYKEDFGDYIKVFAEDIWNNCVNLPKTGDSKDQKYTLINSVKYFMSFSKNEEYFPFFQKELTQILTKLIIPGLYPSEDDFNMFLDEPKAFTEKAFTIIQYDKTKSTITDFLGILSKFYREELLASLKQILEEIMKNRSISNMKNEIVFLEIFLNGVVRSSNSKHGAYEIICSQDFINYIYKNLIETFLFDFLQNISNFNNEDQMNNILFFIIYQIKFIAMFHYFLNIDKIYQLAKDLILQTFNIQNDSYRYCLLALLNRLMNRNQFEIIDNLNIQVNQLSFYQKYYLNPRKIKIKFKKINLKNAEEQLQEKNFNQIYSILESMYNFILKDEKQINFYFLQFLNDLIQKTTPSQIHLIEQPYLQLIELFLTSIINMKIIHNSQILNQIFQIQARFLIKTNLKQLENVKNLLFKLYCTNNSDFVNLTLQTFSILILKYKIPISQNQFYLKLFTNSLNIDNYNGEMIGACTSYFIFIKTSLLLDKSLFDQYWKQICLSLRQILSLKLIRLYYKFLKELIVNKIPLKNLLELIFLGLSCTLQGNNQLVDLTQKKDNFVQHLVYEEFLQSICLALNLSSFRELFQDLEILNLRDIFLDFLKSENFSKFLSHYAALSPRNFINLTLTKQLIEEKDLFYQNNLQQEFSNITNSILMNIYLRKNNFKKLVNSYRIRKKEKSVLNEMSYNSYSNAFLLKEIPNDFIQFRINFLLQVKSNVQNIDQFIVDKFKTFITQENIALNQLITKPQLSQLFNQLLSQLLNQINQQNKTSIQFSLKIQLDKMHVITQCLILFTFLVILFYFESKQV